jgi:ribosomal protein L16/L10AE
MGKGKGSLNYWVTPIKANQQVYSLYGLTVKDGLMLIFNAKSSVKLFSVKTCFRWVD